MITISVDEIKGFLNRSRKIKTSGRMPILSYLRLDCIGDKATITKTNLNAYCMHEIDAEFEQNISLLLDEKLLIALISNSSANKITISVKNDSVFLSDSQSSVSFSVEDVANFPKFPERSDPDKSFDMPSEALYAIKSAIAIMDTSLENQYSYCFLCAQKGRHDVFATHMGITMFVASFEQELPTIAISAEAGGIITMFESIRFYFANNYNFYDCGKTLYGFVQSAYKAPNYERIYSKVTQTDFFEISREELIRFCELTISSTGSIAPYVSLSDNGALGITSLYEDDGFKISTTRNFEVEKNFTLSEFGFNPKILLPLLKAFDSQTIRFSPVSKIMYCLWSPERPSIKALLSALIKQ